MALSRAFLRGLGLTEEQVGAIIEAHVETVDGLKAVNTDLQDKLTRSEEALKAAGEYENKYNTLAGEYEAFKAETSARTARQAKENAYRGMLNEAGVSAKRIDGIMKYDASAIEALELDDAGKVVNAEAVTKAIADNWSDFITKTETVPAAMPETPPATRPASYSAEDIRTMSAADINANWDAVMASLKGE